MSTMSVNPVSTPRLSTRQTVSGCGTCACGDPYAPSTAHTSVALQLLHKGTLATASWRPGSPANSCKLCMHIAKRPHKLLLCLHRSKTSDPADCAQVWDVRVRRSIRSIYGPYICGSAIAAHKGTLATASWRPGSPVQLWDWQSGVLQTNVPVQAPQGHALSLYASAFARGGTQLVTGGSGTTPGIQVRCSVCSPIATAI
jgi:hypothetical protein